MKEGHHKVFTLFGGTKLLTCNSQVCPSVQVIYHVHHSLCVNGRLSLVCLSVSPRWTIVFGVCLIQRVSCFR